MKSTVEKAARPRRYVSNEKFYPMVGRMLTSMAARISHSDAADLRELTALRDDFDNLIGTAIRGLREDGYTWASIGEALGVTSQAAVMRYKAYCDDENYRR